MMSMRPQLRRVDGLQQTEKKIELVHKCNQLMAGWSLEQDPENAKKHISHHDRQDTVVEREDEDAVERHWPKEVVQMILCRLPFPSLRKLQGISKTWKDVYTSALHCATLEGRLFQTDFLSVSSRWPEFCPVFVTSQPYYHQFWGFNQSTRTWQQIHKPIQRSFPDPNRVGQTQQRVLFGQLSGALMCLVQRIAVENALYLYLKQLLQVMVLNIFTGEYKVLPPLTEAEVYGDLELLVMIYDFFPDLEQIQWGSRCPEDFVFTFDPESGGYKVYLLYESTSDEETQRLQREHNEVDLRGILMFEYLSTTGAWKAILSIGQRNSERFKISLNTGSTAYLNGALYTMSLEPTRVWKYYLEDASDISEATFNQSDILDVKIDLLHAWGLVEVHKMLLVAIVIDEEAYIYEVDKETLEWTIISFTPLSLSSTETVKRKKGSSVDTEQGKEAERNGEGQKLKEDSSSDSKEDEERSGKDEVVSRTESDKKVAKEFWEGPKIKCPQYHIVSDSKCVYFWPYYASEKDVWLYSLIDRKWSTLTIPKTRTESEMQIIAGCSRPGDEPFTVV